MEDNQQQQPPGPPDAPDKEKMEQIRLRRMQKLSGPPKVKTEGDSAKIKAEQDEAATSSASSPRPATSQSTESITKPKINVKPATSPAENPFSKLTARPANGNATPVSRSVTNLKRKVDEDEQSSAKEPVKKSNIPSAEEDIETWENHTLGHIFRFTLDPSEKVDGSKEKNKLIYLPNLSQELDEEQQPRRLSVEKLDQAIIEACSKVPHNKPVLDYLLPCWKRVLKAMKGLRGYANAKDGILKEAKRLCMSHCIFAVEMPEFYDRESNPATDSLTPYLLAEPGEDLGICPDFLAEALSRFDDDENVPNMLTKAIAGVSLQLSSLTMNDHYKPYIQALKTMSGFPKLLTAIAEHPLFVMAQSAPGIEKHTLLGPFFRISPLQREVSREYFAVPKTMDKRHINTSQEALRLTLQTHQRDLLDIINSFVRASPKARNRTLDWFAYIVNANHKRRAMQVDPNSVSSDGFMMNVTVVLDGLSEPFMDTTFSKVSKIDIDYLRREPRVDIKDETKLNADQNASDEYYKEKAEGTSNFISEIFFLTLAAHHYGTEAINATIKSIDREIKHLMKSIAQLELERPKFLGHPQQLAQFEARLKQWTDLLEKSMALRLTIEGVLGDKQMQAKSLLFMRYVTVWLLRVASQSDYTPEKSISLPLPSEAPDAFKFLPEYALEDIVSNFSFIITRVPEIMISAVGNELMTLSITFLTNSEYIKNPYLKAKLVSLLFHGTWPVYHRAKGVIGDALTGEKFANDNLLHALMKFYIEVESTGAHTQFYDKFNIRYEIFQVIKCIWSNDIYTQRLTQESKINTEFFLRFVNLLLNDATYVLDEALTKFPKIHDLQAELRQPQALTAEERATKEEELATAEGQAQSYMQLTNETVSMMKMFTKTLSASFTMPEIVDRVAAMVDYTLDTLVGPKSNNLRVEDPGKYQFHPKQLLGEFIDIFLNLGVSDNFIMAVARDGRSYKPANFETASKILTRFALKSAQDIDAFEKLQNKFKNAKEIDDQAEEDLGEIPDEYLDPLLYTLMKDPVILPMSRTTVDRSTIRSHLLSDPHDPFNRSPLKIEDVVDDVEMKAKVEAFLLEMKAKALEAKQAKMDTSEG